MPSRIAAIESQAFLEYIEAFPFDVVASLATEYFVSFQHPLRDPVVDVTRSIFIFYLVPVSVKMFDNVPHQHSMTSWTRPVGRTWFPHALFIRQ